MIDDRPVGPAMQGDARIAVWSGSQRVLHLVMFAGILVAWWVGEEHQLLHNRAGYCVLAATLCRFAMGFGRSRYARFGSFLRHPATALKYFNALLSGTARRYLGHNPLGGWMVVALLASTLVACASGVLYTTDALWGLAWLERLHRWSAWAVLALAAIHIAAVIAMCAVQRENLVMAMITGKKRAIPKS